MKFEFIINLKAAKQIGLTAPPNVLARTRVIREGHGSVKVVLKRLKIPLNLPLQRETFNTPLLKKGGRGEPLSERVDFSEKHNKFIGNQ